MNIRAWETSIEIGVFGVGLNVAVAPFNWRKPFFAHKKQCWSKGSHFHLFCGPLHIYSREFGLYAFVVGVDFSLNGFWWDKPVKRQTDEENDSNA